MDRNKRLERDLEIIELCYTKSQKELGNIFNLSQSNIGLILKKHKIYAGKKSRLNMSKLKLDIDYFQHIDTPKKAYWMGYLAADGNIKKSNNKVSLGSKDLEIIQKFKNDIGAEHTISEIKIYDKRTNKTYNSFTIQIGNEIFTNHLINQGVTCTKSKTYSFPNIEEKYYCYFIAGLFDGDGSIGLRKTKYETKLRTSLISTLEVLVFIQNYIFSHYQIKELKLQQVTKKQPNVWKMSLYKDSVKFLDFIYQDQEFNFLQRKHKIYLANIKS